MRLIYDHAPFAALLKVPCYTCGKMDQLTNMIVDLDGEAYKSYFCKEHIPTGATRILCDRANCEICGGGKKC